MDRIHSNGPYHDREILSCKRLGLMGQRHRHRWKWLTSHSYSERHTLHHLAHRFHMSAQSWRYSQQNACHTRKYFHRLVSSLLKRETFRCNSTFPALYLGGDSIIYLNNQVHVDRFGQWWSLLYMRHLCSFYYSLHLRICNSGTTPYNGDLSHHVVCHHLKPHQPCH